ncbi:hypothetical protein B7P43_G15280 [Cryptotermes secundus]|uniref:Uncharacterized protein n=1 Tax=Cryptotermes secundus TaxID=105785 RepID=A0A2J7PBI1_9NEOP|nr:hypothetical protein B7P43_G15280 [Cryptotermes secundus]
MGEKKEENLDTTFNTSLLNVVLHINCSYTFKCNLSKYENYFTIIIMEYIM